MVGAKLVLPGAKAADPKTLVELDGIGAGHDACGVPTVADCCSTEASGVRLSSSCAPSSAAPLSRSIIESFREQHDVETRQAGA
jgi:hypothetical protein